jgi:methionyl-tRNA formyltransferase
MVKTLTGLTDGSIQPRPQNHAGATLAPILNREDGRMDFAARTATELKNRWRGFQPWPGAFTALDGKKLIVHRMEVVDAPGSQEAIPAEPASILPGQICIEDHRLLVACAGNTWLELIEVQLEGKKRLAAAEFLRGIALPANARLGTLTQ